MLNEQIMMDTVNRLIEAGIDDPTIISTLVDAGLTTEEANTVLAKAKQPAPQDLPAPQRSVQPQEVQILREQVQTTAQQQDLHQTMMSSALDEHSQKLDSIAKTVDEVRSNIDSSKTSVDSSLSFRVSEMEQKLEDINAATKASIDLLGKILENNRKILVELEAKK